METPETINRLVSRGLGSSLLAKLAVEDKRKRGEVLCVPMDGEGGKRNINLVYNKKFQLSKPVQHLIETVQAVYGGF